MLASELSGPLTLVNAAAVVSPVSGSTARWALNPSCRRSPGLVGVPGLRIHSRDHPVRGGLAGDPPSAVGAVGPLGRLDVLAGDQRQQRDRLGRLTARRA